jgi:hypothetical protein
MRKAMARTLRDQARQVPSPCVSHRLIKSAAWFFSSAVRRSQPVAQKGPKLEAWQPLAGGRAQRHHRIRIDTTPDPFRPHEMPVISPWKVPLPHFGQVRPSSLHLSLSFGLPQPVQSMESRFRSRRVWRPQFMQR